MAVHITCDWCGDEYETYKSRVSEDKNNFCSKDCYRSYQRRDQTQEPCSWCGSTVRIPPSRIGPSSEFSIENHFCDKDCESEYKSQHWVGEDHPSYDGGTETVLCEECGAEYEVKPSVVDNTRFCSNECHNSNQEEPTVELQCGWCNDTVHRKPHNVKGDEVFCDSDCFSSWMSDQRSGDGNPQWRGGNPEYYGPNWTQQRRKALSRDEYACVLCEMTRDEHYEEYSRDLEVHHKIPIRAFDDLSEANELRNLVTLCKGCHRDVECRNRAVPHNDLVAPA